MQSQQRSYWRLTSLDQFDGNVWSSNGSYERATGSLPHRVPSDVDTVVVRAGVLDRGPRHDLVAGRVRAPQHQRGQHGGALRARQLDADRRHQPAELERRELPRPVGAADVRPGAARPQATDPPPAVSSPRRRELPADLDPARAARGRDASSPAPRRRTTRRWRCRTTSATTSPTTSTCPPGQSDNAIVDFLFVSKRGYCEQFAGTYAAMARSIGLPTRVAVGFTPGEEDPNKPGHVPRARACTPTRGPRCTSPARAGCRSSRRRPGARRTPSSTRTCPSSRPPRAAARRRCRRRRRRQHADDRRLDRDDRRRATRRGPDDDLRDRDRAVVLVDAPLRRPGLDRRRACCSSWRSSTCSPCPIVYALYRRRRRKAASEPDAQVRLAWQESVEAAQTLGVSPWRVGDGGRVRLTGRTAPSARRSSRCSPVWCPRPTTRPTASTEEQARHRRGLSDEVTHDGRAA